VSGLHILALSVIGGTLGALAEIRRLHKTGNGYPSLAFLMLGLLTFGFLMVSGAWDGAW
jgi:hypothetical protein